MDRLSDELKRCLDNSGCSECNHYEQSSVLTCRNLLQDSYERIKKYEDLEKQEKLLQLPCELGDTTYWISDEDEEGNKVLTVMENNPLVGIAVKEDGIYIMEDGGDDYQKVGTRWAYLTKEEAESALNELQR